MVDVTKECQDRYRRESAVRREMTVCDGIINTGASDSADLARAEKAALQAELDYIRAQFEADVTLKAMAESAGEFAQRPPVPRGHDWHEYILTESKDYDDYLRWFCQYLNIRQPGADVRELTEKQDAAKRSEQAWLHALEQWDKELARHSSSMKSNIPDDPDPFPRAR